MGETGYREVAEDTFGWQAKTALDALPVEWDRGKNPKISECRWSCQIAKGRS